MPSHMDSPRDFDRHISMGEEIETEYADCYEGLCGEFVDQDFVVYSLYYVSADDTTTDHDGYIEDFSIDYEQILRYNDFDKDGEYDEADQDYDEDVLSASVITGMFMDDRGSYGIIPQRIDEYEASTTFGMYSYNTALINYTTADLSGDDWLSDPTHGVMSTYPDSSDDTWILTTDVNYSIAEREALKEKFNPLMTNTEEDDFEHAWIAAYTNSLDELAAGLLAALGTFSEPVFNFSKTKNRMLQNKDLSLMASSDVTEASVTVEGAATLITMEY